MFTNPLTLKETLLFTTIPIKTTLKDGSQSIGTGFLFLNKLDEKISQILLVTNKHVIENSKLGIFTFHKADNNGNPILKENITLNLDNFENQWVKHPDDNIDLAFMNISSIFNHLDSTGKNPFFKCITQDLIQNQENLIKNTDAMEEILFIGYPEGIYDIANNLPVIRKGITATPIYVDFNGMPCFLIDASVFPGSSGSPVFIINTGGYTPREGGLSLGTRIIFLGILAKVYINSSFNQLSTIPTQNTHGVITQEKIDLGIVFKSTLLLDFLKRNEAKI